MQILGILILELALNGYHQLCHQRIRGRLKCSLTTRRQGDLIPNHPTRLRVAVRIMLLEPTRIEYRRSVEFWAFIQVHFSLVVKVKPSR